jgi:flagellar motor component MotA
MKQLVALGGAILGVILAYGVFPLVAQALKKLGR